MALSDLFPTAAWVGHTDLKSLISLLSWLLLWCSVSFCSLVLSRYLVFYGGFQVPWFLAIIAAALTAVLSRVFVFLNQLDTNYSRNWTHLCSVGGAYGLSVALDIASLCYLPVVVAILLKAASPAVSYWLAVLLQEEDMQWSPGCAALLVFSSVVAALLPHSHALSLTGLSLQAAAVFVDTLWQRWHLRTAAGSSGLRTDTCKAPCGLVLLADTAPAAVLALLLPLCMYDIPKWEQEQFRLRVMLPWAAVACLLLCGLLMLKTQPLVMQGLTKLPVGQAARTVRDVCVGLVAAKALDEHLDRWQWSCYTAAQLAAISLFMAGASSKGGSGSGIGVYNALAQMLPIKA